MSWLPAVVWLLPGITGLCLWLGIGAARRKRTVALVAAATQLLLALALIREVASGEILVHEFGSWAPPFGIAFLADRLSGLFVLLQSLLLVVTLAVLRPSAHGERVVERAIPLLFLLSWGLVGAFLTGDLFNLFVAFEVVLLVSYLLVQVPGTPRSLRAAFPNVTINLLASVFFFVAVGLLYGVYGTVNLVDLGGRIAAGGVPQVGVVSLTLLTLAFGIKAGLVPVLFWLPATYPTMTGPVAALFAGMMTKLGVFALLRTGPLLMRETPIPDILIWVGSISALFGVLAALAQTEIRRLLGFHIVSQVGYMILGLGLMTTGAIAAAIFYLIHHVVVKSILFFVADSLERSHGTRDLGKMADKGFPGGNLAFLFLAAGLSLAGLPPLSGFFAKLGLIRAGIELQASGVVVVLVVASFFTLVSMLKVWRLAFESPARGEKAPIGSVRGLAGVWILTAVSFSIALAVEPVYRYAEATAEQLMEGEPSLPGVAMREGSRGAQRW